ncbi:hypothetical protein LIER_31760 [Lithospermum erythrorhizon]|uniref:MULE transposase domain-containing protein n=1 Tax=Lithospermum erythrorhizon TaxID=34254 RepID=A0AAV3RVX1_LITER
MTGQVHERDSPFDEQTFRIAYEERKNYFSARIHYGGKLLANLIFYYDAGEVELFDYCDADIFEIGSVNEWAFRVGLRFGDFAACVYKHPEIESLDGLFPLKSAKNVMQFVRLTESHKFIDVYFLKADNTDMLLDMEDENGNIKLSDWSIEFLKAKADERAKVSAERGSVGVVEFNLDEENSNSSRDCDTSDVEEVEAMDMPTEENYENQEEHEGSDEDSEYDVESEGDDEESHSDSEYSVEDVMYGKEQDNFDDEKLDVVPESTELPEDVAIADLLLQQSLGIKNRKGKGKQPVFRTFDAKDVDNSSQAKSGVSRKKKKYKGPYARHGVQFRERRLAGNVPNASDDSNDALDENVDALDFDSGNTTSHSDKDVTYKFTDDMRRKNRYVHFNEKTIKNPKDKKLNDKDLVIKTISKNHTNCVASKRRRLIKSSWLAKVLIDWFRLLPDMSFKVLKVVVDKKFGLMIADHQARRVRENALKTIEGDHNEQYNMIFDYIEELKKPHHGLTVFAECDVSLEDGNAGVFKGIYVCLRPLIDGFKVGGRKLIGLDGCHTKGVHKIQILSAVALDPNNGWWPLCWAVVEKDNKKTWKWFIQALSQDTGIVDEEDYVIMSDKQKGLQSALGELLPRIEYRKCVQHIYKNFKRHHGSQFLRNKLWVCARASIMATHLAEMYDFKEADPVAYDWIEKNARLVLKRKLSMRVRAVEFQQLQTVKVQEDKLQFQTLH